jgi:hypothetical protein
MKTIVTASTAQDFLALVPQLVGFESEESIVFVAFRGKRSIGAMRYDLPVVDTAQPETANAHRRIATTLVGMVSKLPGVDAVLPVVYTGQAFAGETGIPGAEFVRALVQRFEFSGIDVKDALCVAGDGWGSYLSRSVPESGHPLSDIHGSRIGETIPADQRRALGSIEEWTRLPRVDLAVKERVARRIRSLSEAVQWLRAAGDRDAQTAIPTGAGRSEQRRAPLSEAQVEAVLDAYLLDDLPYFVEMVFQCDPAQLPDRTAAMLIHVAQSPALRDVLLMQWAFDRDTGDRVLDDAGRFTAGADAGTLETSSLMLGEGRRPDPERIESALAIVKALAARAPRAQRPPLFCILAWLNWALGRSSVAGRFVDQSIAIDPRYGFGEILQAMLSRGMLPEWAFERRL